MSAIYVHRYKLVAKVPANRLSVRHEYEGALVRIGSGYACIHPWPELGDLPLNGQLDLLSVGRVETRILERAIECAKLDGDAREQGRNLFDGLLIPESHYLWDPGADVLDQMEYVSGLGLRAIKLKCNGNVTDHELLTEIKDELPEGVLIRLDLNGALAEDTFGPWWQRVPPEIKERLDLIEDPTDYQAEVWQRLSKEHGLDLGLDWGEEPVAADAGYRWRVIKPAVDEERIWTEPTEDVGLIFTSYMDHPLGQAFAAYAAANAKADYGDLCGLAGLASHTRFEPNVFSEALEIEDGGRLKLTGGVGLGFDDLLESLDWQKL